MKWFRKAAEQGYDEAQTNLGVMYERGWGVARDYGEAEKWFTLAIEQGEKRAHGNLGWMYFFGRGVPWDLKKAFHHFRQSSGE